MADVPTGTRRAWRARIFAALLAVFIVAYLWRMSGQLEIDGVTSHLSNFYLTGAAVTLIAGKRAFVEADDGAGPASPSTARSPHRRRALLAAAAFAAVNVVGEIVLAIGNVDEAINRAMGNVNTTDPLDGVAGLVAVALVVALLPRPRARPATPTGLTAA